MPSLGSEFSGMQIDDRGHIPAAVLTFELPQIVTAGSPIPEFVAPTEIIYDQRLTLPELELIATFAEATGQEPDPYIVFGIAELRGVNGYDDDLTAEL